VLLVVGALLLAVPVFLGLYGAISTSAAVFAALSLELLAFVVSRPAVRRLDDAHQARRPGRPAAN
jgi:membrane protein implicated in regulation of membrane protease activity